ncbi:MAG TPA: hypothetical protein VM290_00185 [Gaiellaceae bacterium]|jgi:hypothetical protein|nr:hypothetical protein [Gaiellaceae bacterium]
MLRNLVLLLLALGLAGCGGDGQGDGEGTVGAPPTEAAPPVSPARTAPGETTAEEMRLELGERNDSGVSGSVVLTPEDADTRIVIELDDPQVLPAGAYLQEGECTAVRPEAAEVLALFVDGRSETVLEQELTNLLNGRFAVTVYLEEREDLQQPDACADIGKENG